MKNLVNAFVSVRLVFFPDKRGNDTVLHLFFYMFLFHNIGVYFGLDLGCGYFCFCKALLHCRHLNLSESRTFFYCSDDDKFLQAELLTDNHAYLKRSHSETNPV